MVSSGPASVVYNEGGQRGEEDDLNDDDPVPPLTSRGLRHLPLRPSPNFPFLKGLILRRPIHPPLTVLAGLAALHLNPRVSTRARVARTLLRGVPPHDPCHIAPHAASHFLVRSPVQRFWASWRHFPPSGAILSLPPGPVLTLLPSLRLLKARHHATHFSMPSTLSPPFLKAQRHVRLV